MRRTAWISTSVGLAALAVGYFLWLATKPGGESSEDQGTCLYPDEFVEKWERDQADPRRLKLVPRREAYPRGDVFKRLRIDERRLREGGAGTVNFGTTLWWQVSPSYFLECNTTTNGKNRGLADFDPRKTVSDLKVRVRSAGYRVRRRDGCWAVLIRGDWQ
jgi:hypothetical protein